MELSTFNAKCHTCGKYHFDPEVYSEERKAQERKKQGWIMGDSGENYCCLACRGTVEELKARLEILSDCKYEKMTGEKAQGVTEECKGCPLYREDETDTYCIENSTLLWAIEQMEHNIAELAEERKELENRLLQLKLKT